MAPQFSVEYVVIKPVVFTTAYTHVKDARYVSINVNYIVNVFVIII